MPNFTSFLRLEEGYCHHDGIVVVVVVVVVGVPLSFQAPGFSACVHSKFFWFFSIVRGVSSFFLFGQNPIFWPKMPQNPRNWLDICLSCGLSLDRFAE